MDHYISSLTERYCRDSEISKHFSEKNKIQTWRQLWIWLAQSEMELGLNQITEDMIAQLVSNKNNIDGEKLREAEKLSKHEVMANIEVYSELCPKAAGIIHLGATSCFVQDNADLIIQKEAFHFIMKRIIVCLRYLTDFAKKHARNPTLGRTHYQPASLVTVGKRACIWAQELLMALRKVKYAYSEMRFRGIKGATGTQDTFLTLFHGKEEIVEKLDQLVTEKAGFINRFHICGQNYPRQQDTLLLFALSNIGSIAKRIAHDIRILQGWDEIREPFEKIRLEVLRCHINGTQLNVKEYVDWGEF